MLRLQLFDRPSVVRDNRPITQFRSQKIEALLYFLAATPGPHPRSRLADLLWPDQPEQAALGNLRYALWNIRQVLDSAPLSISRTSAAFIISGDDVTVDVLEFERQVDSAPQRALELYRGDFLSGFELLDSPPFNDWLRHKQTHYRSRVIALLERLAAQHIDHHRLSEAAAATRWLLDIDPWHEKSHRQLMWLLAATGQRGAAIEQYRRCRQLLADELNLKPEPETTALFERIQQGDIGLEPRIVQSPNAPEAKIAPFLGRAEEHAWLVGQWQTVQRGGSRLALISGEAGIGKTRLVSEATRAISGRGGLLLHGRCFEYSGSVAYQPVAEALRPLLVTAKAQPWQLSDIWLAELAQWSPELREQYPRLPLPLATDRYRLFEAVRQLFRQIAARQPLCLFVDDLHWADVDSLDLLGYLVQQCDRLLLIGAYRPEETAPQHPLLTLRDGLYRTHRVAEMALKRLSRPVVAQLVAAVEPSTQLERVAKLMYRLSEGNPFILLETLREMREQDNLATFETEPFDLAASLPQTVQATIQRRLSRLAGESEKLLPLAAVIGREFDIELLQTASQRPAAAVLDAVDDWLNRQLVRQVAAADDETDSLLFDFSHDLIRTVALQALSPPRRQALHQQVAQALEQRQQAGREVPVEWLAHHFHQANQHQAAVTYLRQAGQQARSVYALPLALARYRLAVQHWSQAYRLAAPQTPLAAHRQRWEILREEAEVLRLSGQPEPAEQLLAQAAVEIAKRGDDTDRLPLIVAQLPVLHQLDQLDDCRQLARTGLQLAAVALDAVAEGACHTTLGHCALRDADYDTALGYYEAALINYTQAGDTTQAAACLKTIAQTYLMTNQLERALACIGEAIAYAQTGQQQDVLAECWLLKARTLLWLGELDNGLAACAESVGLSEAVGLSLVLAHGLALQSYLLLLSGQNSAALQLSQQALGMAREGGHPAALAETHFFRGVICLAQVGAETAREHFESAQRASHLSEQRQIELMSYQGAAALALGQTKQAIELSRQAISLLQLRQNGVEGVQRIYRHHARILNAIDDPAAQQAGQAAVRLVQQQAAAISDVSRREQFWQLPWNQKIS